MARKLTGWSKIIVRNALDKKLDPKLVASIIVVESNGNPLAISGRKSVGIMQIHLPTWSNVVDFTEKNPFDPEVNIEIGTDILANYLSAAKTSNRLWSLTKGLMNQPTVNI
jgi:soluble lytic murein transglycosylase-like protein